LFFSEPFMSENSTTPAAAPEQKTWKSKKTAIIMGLMTIVIIIQGIQIYLDIDEKSELKAENASTEKQLASTLQRMTEIKNELDLKIVEIQKLGGDITELQKAKAEIEKQLQGNRQATGKLIKELKDKVEGYEQLLKIKDEEIDRLKVVNKELLTENTSLKTEKNQLGDSINRLSQSKDELTVKVAIASQLKAENFTILSVNEKGKERESPFKKKQLSKLKIEFTIAENNVAPIEGKKIMIRIIDENNQVLFDVARGSGTFTFNGKEEFYTAAQEILFDNTRQKLTFVYDKGSEYDPGTYTAEVYTDDYQMGKGKFIVK